MHVQSKSPLTSYFSLQPRIYWEEGLRQGEHDKREKRPFFSSLDDEADDDAEVDKESERMLSSREAGEATLFTGSTSTTRRTAVPSIILRTFSESHAFWPEDPVEEPEKASQKAELIFCRIVWLARLARSACCACCCTCSRSRCMLGVLRSVAPIRGLDGGVGSPWGWWYKLLPERSDVRGSLVDPGPDDVDEDDGGEEK